MMRWRTHDERSSQSLHYGPFECEVVQASRTDKRFMWSFSVDYLGLEDAKVVNSGIAADHRAAKQAALNAMAKYCERVALVARAKAEKMGSR